MSSRRVASGIAELGCARVGSVEEDAGEELERSPPLRLAVVRTEIQFPMSLRAVIRRVQDRVFEKRIRHLQFPFPSIFAWSILRHPPHAANIDSHAHVCGRRYMVMSYAQIITESGVNTRVN